MSLVSPSAMLIVAALALAVMQASAASADDSGRVKAGARPYETHCATCHGDELQNNTGVSFDLRRLREEDRTRFVNSVLAGKNAMPSWQGVLDADKIAALWTYIRANAYQ